jgi:sugar O-acyltransferase (sialic acid O-acetyltransferase NeuD family)
MTTGKKVVVFGDGDVAQLAHFYMTHDSPDEVVGFTVDGERQSADQFCGLPVSPFEDIVERYSPDEYDMFVALSYSRMNEVRARKYDDAKRRGYNLASYVSTKLVSWPGVEIGDNCFIFENQTIQPFVKIGNDVTMWSGNHIGHHSTIGDHVFMTSHCVVSGHCEVKDYAFLGVNCTLRDGITIGERSVVGAGATVMKSTKENGVYVGPSAELRARDSRRVRYFTNTRYEDKK